MGTILHAISNIQISKADILAKKEDYLKQLKALKLEHTLTPTHYSNGAFKEYVTDEGDWEYELPKKYNRVTDNLEPDHDNKEVIYFDSPFVFQIGIYESCLEITTIYRYNYLYSIGKTDALNAFRKNVYDIISIFGGTEIIYLADNSSDVLSEYLCNQVWEGTSYLEIKNDILKKDISLVADYKKLNAETLTYSKTKEIVFDEFKDLKS